MMLDLNSESVYHSFRLFLLFLLNIIGWLSNRWSDKVKHAANGFEGVWKA
jgi:hypothetical protein